MGVTIYIVDDERMAIEYLKYLLQKVNAEHEVVGESTNSVRALSEISRLEPNIVFVDIEMPVMDGLKLSEEIHKRTDAKIFLLTSYRDFDYVQKGIQIGVTDYILKNHLDEEMLESLLTRVSRELTLEKRERHRLLEYNVRQFFLDQSGVQKADRFYEQKPMQRYAVILLLIRPRIMIRRQAETELPHVDCYNLQMLACPEGISCKAFTQMSGHEYCGMFFISGEVTDGQVPLLNFCEELLQYMKDQKIFCQCILSDTCYHFSDLPEAYQEMHSLRDFLYQNQGKEIWLIRELRSKKREKVDLFQNLETLQGTINEGNTEKAEEQLDLIFQRSRENLNIWGYTESLLSVNQLLTKVVQEKRLPEAFREMPDSFENTQKAEAFTKERLLQIMQTDRQQEEENQTVNSFYIQQALEFIRGNYAKDISVSDIADAAGISEGHLRRLFKQELGTRVMDYLSDYRLECAKILMQNGETSLSEIWSRTGFASAQYFSSVFKKKEGMTPREYIRQIRNRPCSR